MEPAEKELHFEDIAALAAKVRTDMPAGGEEDEARIDLPANPAAGDELVLVALEEGEFRQEVAHARASVAEEVVDLDADKQDAPPEPTPRRRAVWWHR